MKTQNFIKTAFLFLLFFSLISISCRSDDDGGNGGDAADGTIAAKVSGSQFNSAKMSTSGQFMNSGGTTSLSLIGSSADGKAIAITAIGVSEPGTYQIGGNANISISGSYTEVNTSNPSASQVWQAPFDSSVSGELKISEISSTKAVGTFSFDCKNVNGDQSIKNVTEGSFNITF